MAGKEEINNVRTAFKFLEERLNMFHMAVVGSMEGNWGNRFGLFSSQSCLNINVSSTKH